MSRQSPRFGAVQTIQDPTRNRITASDELFFALEGYMVEGAGDAWRIEVQAVHSTLTHYWVQLNLRGRVQRGLTLRTTTLDARHVLGIVRDWLNDSVSTEMEPCVVAQTFAAPVPN